MYRLIFMTSLLIISTDFVMASCDNVILGAKYKITTTQLNGKIKNINKLTLWRNGNQVAHAYENAGITEVWERLKNGQLRLIKYFDEYKQGIEYEPNEINIKHNIASWQLKKQLIPPSLLNNMRLVANFKKGCDARQQYENKKNKITLRWLVNYKLVEKLKIRNDNEILSWKLIEIIEDSAQVKNVFTSHAKYKMTDYADVGDNEADPFLSKMINMGFVSHSASGIVNQNGQMIEGAH